MAQPTEIYVDPSIAGDSGAGTKGDPYGDLEWAIEQETFDLTNGNRINIKAGTAEVLAASLETAMADTGTSIAWVPAAPAAPLIFEGYTTDEGDGGIGDINNGGSNISIYTGTAANMHFKNLHCHNTGTSKIINMGSYGSIMRCELDTSSAVQPVMWDNACTFMGNYVHSTTGTSGAMASNAAGGIIAYNYIDATSLTSNGGACISISGSDPAHCYNNICVAGTGLSSRGIDSGANSVAITNNSIYSAGSASIGIVCNNGLRGCYIMNNIIEGYSVTNGDGISLLGAGGVVLLTGNSFFNCDNNILNAGSEPILSEGWANDTTTNETLTVSAFTSASTGDFSPVDTDSVKEGSLPDDFGRGLV